MTFIVFNEDYTFPILFSCSNIDYENIGLIKNKDIRYRIYNYISVDDNVSLARPSKALYLDMRNWFKLYLPSFHLPCQINTRHLYTNTVCNVCEAKNRKHTIFGSMRYDARYIVNRSKLLNLNQSRDFTEQIKSPIIQLQYRQVGNTDNYLGHSGRLTQQMDDKNILTYSFALYPEEYQPSGIRYIPDRNDDTIILSLNRFCWKCMYLLHS
jgi:hypothetical protein